MVVLWAVASDPLKLAQFREVLRLRRACLAARRCSPSDAAFREFDRLLTKVGEHTWGVDVKVPTFNRPGNQMSTLNGSHEVAWVPPPPQRHS